MVITSTCCSSAETGHLLVSHLIVIYKHTNYVHIIYNKHVVLELCQPLGILNASIVLAPRPNRSRIQCLPCVLLGKKADNNLPTIKLTQ